MSGGGPPHQPHNRHVPPANMAWNHLQVPSYFPRQPQLAHMQTDPSILHQSTWHTPTTEGMKLMPTHVLSEMLKNEALFPRDCVDLSLTRNGNQNGEIPTTPISLSVRDTNKINSLPPSLLDIQAMELTKIYGHGVKPGANPGAIRSTSISPGLKSASPGLKSSSPSVKSLSPGRKSVSPGPKSVSPGLSLGGGIMAPVSATISTPDAGKNLKRSNVRVDSILERLNPTSEKIMPYQEAKHDQPSTTTTSITEKPPTDRQQSQSHSVIVQAASSYDENSNSSGTNLPSGANPKEDDSGSMHSNEDSLDSTKSRRKRKPSKTIRVNKEEDIKTEVEKAIPDSMPIDQPHNHQDRQVPPSVPASDPIAIATILEDNKVPERRRSSDELDELLPAKTRRKTSSESETIDDIAAMVQEGLKEKGRRAERVGECKLEEEVAKAAHIESMDSTKEVSNESAPTDDSDIKENMSELPTQIDELKEDVKSTDEAPDEVDGPVNTEKDEIAMAKDSSVDVKRPVTVSVIKTKDHLEDSLASSDQVDGKTDITTSDSSQTPVIHLEALLAAELDKKKHTNTSFVDVENKLEEMFAGIVENHSESPQPMPLAPPKNDATLDLNDDSLLKLDDSVSSTSREEPAVEEPVETPILKEEDKVPVSEIKKEEQKKPVAKKTQKSRPTSGVDAEEDGAPSPKRKRFTKTKGSTPATKKISRSPTTSITKAAKKSIVPSPTKSPVKTLASEVKDIYAYDSGSNTSSSRSRGPFVQIRGHRDSPLSVSVINTPLAADDDGEKKLPKNKKYHDDSEYRHKVRSKGLHCSTLSTKYDAERKDASWICAFCKRGPHASEFTGPSAVSEGPAPGDLFGPYFITTQCPEFERRLDDPYDRQFKSRKITKALDANAAASAGPKSNKKAKRKSESCSADQSDSNLGITPTAKGDTFEVWAHEDCLVWSAGVYLVGPKIAGLEEAVWTCSNVPCAACGYRGANVACLRRGCTDTAHLCCARRALWQLDEASFNAYCPTHAR